jgi:hypothetical protein
MRLWLERSERRAGLFGGRIYQLNVSLICDAATLMLIQRHGLAVEQVWMSPAAEALSGEAEGLLDRGMEQSAWRLTGMTSGLALNFEGLLTAWRASREPMLSVGDLIRGSVLESPVAGELLAAEAGIRAGFEALVHRLEGVKRYDESDEDLIEPKPDADLGVPPSDWVRMGGRGR